MTANRNDVPFFVLRLDHPTTNDDATTSDTNADQSDRSSSLHRTKALFTVPDHFASELMLHPILCCGSFFYLTLDDVNVAIPTTTTTGSTTTTTHTGTTTKPSNKNSKHISTTFLSTSYESADPDSTAYEIAKRIAIRVQNLVHYHAAAQLSTGQLPHQPSDPNDMVMTSQQNDWAAQLLFL